MKNALVALTLVLVASSTANAFDCDPEAQIIAKVTSARRVARAACRVEIAPPRLFNENQLCPLQLDEVLMNSILVRTSSRTCPAVGSEISGVIVQSEDGNLVLE